MTRPPDDYQANYMEGGGGSLYHDKITAPLAFHLIFLLPLALVISSAMVTGAPILVPLLSAAPLVLIWLLFSTLRISVNRSHVHVQYGLFGPKIPVEAISDCEAIDYDWKAYGGFGIRFRGDGSVAYNMMGDAGRAVQITYQRGKAERRLLLSSRDPERLATAINQARAMALRKIEAPAEEAEAGAPATQIDETASEAEAVAAEAEAKVDAAAEVEAEAEPGAGVKAAANGATSAEVQAAAEAEEVAEAAEVEAARDRIEARRGG